MSRGRPGTIVFISGFGVASAMQKTCWPTYLRRAACGKTAINAVTNRQLTDLRWQGRINFPNKFLLMKQILGGGVQGKSFFFILKRGRRRSSCLLFVSQAHCTYISWRGCGAGWQGHWPSWIVSKPQHCALSPTAWSSVCQKWSCNMC